LPNDTTLIAQTIISRHVYKLNMHAAKHNIYTPTMSESIVLSLTKKATSSIHKQGTYFKS